MYSNCLPGSREENTGARGRKGGRRQAFIKMETEESGWKACKHTTLGMCVWV